METVDQLELALLKRLELCAREMFEFTGWDDNVDDDARTSVHKVQRALKHLEDWRGVVEFAHSAPSAGCDSGKP